MTSTASVAARSMAHPPTIRPVVIQAGALPGSLAVDLATMPPPVSRDYAIRPTSFGVVAVCVLSGCLTLLLLAGLTWNASDLSLFLQAAHHWPTPYAVEPYRYSPAFAALLSALPSGDVTTGLWRIASVVALVVAMRGIATPLMVALIAPAVVFDVASANVTCFALALMFAVMRWPSVRTAVAYGVLVVLVPKPMFLPVLLYAFVRIPAARPWLLAVGAAGAGMLAYPGYLATLLGSGGEASAVVGFAWHVPLPVTLTLVALGCFLSVAALRRPRLLGLASVLVSGYWLPYVSAPLGLIEIHAP